MVLAAAAAAAEAATKAATTATIAPMLRYRYMHVYYMLREFYIHSCFVPKSPPRTVDVPTPCSTCIYGDVA